MALDFSKAIKSVEASINKYLIKGQAIPTNSLSYYNDLRIANGSSGGGGGGGGGDASASNQVLTNTKLDSILANQTNKTQSTKLTNGVDDVQIQNTVVLGTEQGLITRNITDDIASTKAKQDVQIGFLDSIDTKLNNLDTTVNPFNVFVVNPSTSSTSTADSTAAIVSNKGMVDKVTGSLVGLTSNGLGANSIRDTNIRKFQELGYDSKRLTNKVLSQLAGSNQIDLGSDDSTVQNAVQGVWETIFDVALT